MNLKDKYRIEQSPTLFSIMPNHHLIKTLYWYLLVIAVTLAILFIFYTRLGEGGRILCFGVIIYLAIHSLWDYFFRVNVRYTFSKSDNAVYKSDLFFAKKKLMRLDEVTIYTSSETGSWHYNMGAKKRHFLKPYKISQSFGDGKSSQKKAEAYEAEVLSQIESLILS